MRECGSVCSSHWKYFWASSLRPMNRDPLVGFEVEDFFPGWAPFSGEVCGLLGWRVECLVGGDSCHSPSVISCRRVVARCESEWVSSRSLSSSSVFCWLSRLSSSSECKCTGTGVGGWTSILVLDCGWVGIILRFDKGVGRSVESLLWEDVALFVGEA